jgi:hypothetical protein
VGKGLDSAEFKAAAATLDKNSVALADSITSVYGKAAGDQFLALWRKHIGFFVDYTKGQATKDGALASKAKSDLDGYRADFGAFIASANPNLPKDAVAQELIPHVQSLFDAIDAVTGAKQGDAFKLLRLAAAHMPMTADVLAGGIAKQARIERAPQPRGPISLVLQGTATTTTVPAEPSTSTIIPSTSRAVPLAVSVTAGIPNSRATTAAWDIVPPMSVTTAAACPNSGV